MKPRFFGASIQWRVIYALAASLLWWVLVETADSLRYGDYLRFATGGVYAALVLVPYLPSLKGGFMLRALGLMLFGVLSYWSAITIAAVVDFSRVSMLNGQGVAFEVAGAGGAVIIGIGARLFVPLGSAMVGMAPADGRGSARRFGIGPWHLLQARECWPASTTCIGCLATWPGRSWSASRCTMVPNMNDPELEYVGFWLRVWAAVIDSILVSIILVPLVRLVYGDEYESLKLVQGPADLLISLILPAIAIVIFWISRQATPGKMAISARIVDAKTGGKPRPPN